MDAREGDGILAHDAKIGIRPRPASDSRIGARTVTLEGAAIRLREVRVADALLARALACHAARVNVGELARAAPSTDPVRPIGGEACVALHREDRELVVRLTSRNPDVAIDIVNRSRLLAGRSTSRGDPLAAHVDRTAEGRSE